MSNDPNAMNYGPDPRLLPHRATLVLVLGILSLVVCAPIGIAAWIMGKKDLAAMRAGYMDPTGESTTQVGYILGIIGSVLFGLQILLGCLWVGIFGAALVAGAK